MYAYSSYTQALQERTQLTNIALSGNLELVTRAQCSWTNQVPRAEVMGPISTNHRFPSMQVAHSRQFWLRSARQAAGRCRDYVRQSKKAGPLCVLRQIN